jgi:hypothetical protein
MKKAFVITVLIAALFFAILNIGEAVSIMQDISTYKHLYGLDSSEPHWQFRSIANFQTWHYFITAYNVVLLALCVGYLKFKRNWTFGAVAIISCIAVALFIRNQILWIHSGFDHYPGFDPYIF